MNILRDIIGLDIPVLMSMLMSRKLKDFRCAKRSCKKVMLFKDFADFLLHSFCISGSEGAHSHSIIPVQARVDVEMTELGE